MQALGVEQLQITCGAVCVYPSRVAEARQSLKDCGGSHVPIASGTWLYTICFTIANTCRNNSDICILLCYQDYCFNSVCAMLFIWFLLELLVKKIVSTCHRVLHFSRELKIDWVMQQHNITTVLYDLWSCQVTGKLGFLNMWSMWLTKLLSKLVITIIIDKKPVFLPEKWFSTHSGTDLFLLNFVFNVP